MEKCIKIGIIVPLYNAERFIDRCMASIYAQTLCDYEIILVDDGSTDNSAAICRRYAEADDRITFVQKENGGAGSARNRGIELARGEYLAFPDVDDFFAPEMYEELYAAAAEGEYDIVFSGVNFYRQTDAEPVPDRTDPGVTAAYHSQVECRANVMTFFPTTTIFDVPWNKLYKRSVAVRNNVRFSDTRRCQDAMFNLDFYHAIESARSVGKAYYNYITNTASDVNRKFPKNYIDINILYYTKLIGTLRSWGMYTGDIKRHYDTSVVLSVYGTLGMLENPNWHLSRAEQRDYVKSILAREDLHRLLTDASIRDDAKKEARILTDRDYPAFMRAYRMEKLKNTLRKNKALMRLYRGLRGTQ